MKRSLLLTGLIGFLAIFAVSSCAFENIKFPSISAAGLKEFHAQQNSSAVISHSMVSEFKRNSLGEYSVDVRKSFSSQDEMAVSFVELTGPYGVREAKWEFYDPGGRVYKESYKGINERYEWEWILIEGWPPSDNWGEWTVKFYIDERLQFEESFRIGDDVPNFVPVRKIGGISQFDTNGNDLIDDDEFFSGIDMWLSQDISDQLFFELVDAWIGSTPI